MHIIVKKSGSIIFFIQSSLFQEGRLSDEINKMPRSVREKLNELKKEEIQRLRKILHAKVDVEKGGTMFKLLTMTSRKEHL